MTKKLILMLIISIKLFDFSAFAQSIANIQSPKQWAYNGQYLVVAVTNTASNDIFHDSFEEGDGNSTVGDSKTGHYSYNGSTPAYNNTLSGLGAVSYIFSYWLKLGSNWCLHTIIITISGITYTFSINGQIDVRFYPSGGQMSTYTYDPLIGITSSTDA